MLSADSALTRCGCEPQAFSFTAPPRLTPWTARPLQRLSGAEVTRCETALWSKPRTRSFSDRDGRSDDRSPSSQGQPHSLSASLPSNSPHCHSHAPGSHARPCAPPMWCAKGGGLHRKKSSTNFGTSSEITVCLPRVTVCLVQFTRMTEKRFGY